MKDWRFEQAQRIANDLVGHPRDDPRVEHGVVVVESSEVRGSGCERPGVKRGERGKQR
jgi:hypothetical protein